MKDACSQREVIERILDSNSSLSDRTKVEAAMILWYIRVERNRLVFEDMERRPEDVLTQALVHQQEYNNAVEG